MWPEVLCWIDCVWSFKECVCCACDPSVHLHVPAIGFVYVFVCRKSSFRSLRADQMCLLSSCYFLV